jgi:tetratricopeptide (TPR) repeat protein
MNRKQRRAQAAVAKPAPNAAQTPPQAAPAATDARFEQAVNRGMAHFQAGQAAEAIAAFRAAIALDPQHPLPYSNLGAILRAHGKAEEALACCRQALALDPQHAMAHNNLGLALADLHRHEEAVAALHSAIALEPRNPGALTNLTQSLLALGRFDEAAEACRRAIALRPDSPKAFNNLGSAMLSLGRMEEAIAGFSEAIRRAPDLAPARKNRGLALLHLGRFREGWVDYEARWAADGIMPRRFPRPLWSGEPVAGRTILLIAEQGLGDAIHFARFVPVLAEAGAKVVFEVHPPLARLMRSLSGAAAVVAMDDPLPEFDAYQALMTVPGALGLTSDRIPAPIPYLSAEPERVALWRERIGTDGFKVGIVWQGKGENAMQQSRSVDLGTLAPLARVPGVRLISLQRPGADTAAPADLAVETLGPDFDAGADAFIDSAAVIANLDLVVTIDTSMAHLAGALGRPVWIALKHVPDWRWGLSGDATPWYPTARLYRQPAPGAWEPVFAAIAADLARATADRVP